MIVLSAGLSKSGTAWYFNLTNDLLIAAGHQDARAIRERFRLRSILKHPNCLFEPTPWNLARVMIPSLFGNTFVVKTSRGPSRWLRGLIATRVMRATYIYRDPRDAAVSALAHGERNRELGNGRAFVTLHTVGDSILDFRKRLRVWDEWTRYGQALMVRYEDLVADPVSELRRLAVFLCLDVSADGLLTIVARYREMQRDAGPDGWDSIHFHQGVVGRFREVMTQHEMDLSRVHLGDYLRRMGYVE